MQTKIDHPHPHSLSDRCSTYVEHVDREYEDVYDVPCNHLRGDHDRNGRYCECRKYKCAMCKADR